MAALEGSELRVGEDAFAIGAWVKETEDVRLVLFTFSSLVSVA